MNARLCALVFCLLVLAAFQIQAWRKSKATGGYDYWHVGVASLGVIAALRLLVFAIEMAATESGKLATVGLIGIGDDDYIFVAIGGISLGKLSIAQIRDHFRALSVAEAAVSPPSTIAGTSVLPDATVGSAIPPRTSE